jgi:hypothetical protein
MPGRFTVLEVNDPHLIGQSVWENLPPLERALAHERQFSSWEWAALDRRRFRAGKLPHGVLRCQYRRAARWARRRKRRDAVLDTVASG